MAFDAEIYIPLSEHLVVNRAVDTVAGNATFTHCLVLKHVRLSLLAMALIAGIIGASHHHALWLVDILTMGIMAADAAHLAFLQWVVIGQIKLSFLIEMALKTCFRILAWIDYELALAAAGFHVEATGAMTAFAALAGDAFLIAGDLNPRVLGELEISDLLLVTGRTCIHADVFGARN